MQEMNKRDILLNVLQQLRSNINVRALDYILDEYSHEGDLNNLLFLYYTRAREGRKFEHPSFEVYTFDKNDNESMKEYAEFKKDVGLRNYKADYDYKNAGKIRQKETYCVCEVMNRYRNFYHYGLDVYQWLEANNIAEGE